ncbi:MAG: hypothetical protein ACE5DM_05460, partial [Candidatus Nanoarchaeia archaeon]
MVDLKVLAETLHPLERAVLPLIAKHASLDSLVSASKKKEVEVMRAVQWLENKNIVDVKVEELEIVELANNGIIYAEKGLPERRFLQAIEKDALDKLSIQKKASLKEEELNVCIGLLKKKAAIEIAPGMKISITEQGKKILSK